MVAEEMDFGLNTAQQEAVMALFQQMAIKRANLMADEMQTMAAQGGERRLMKFSDGNGGEVRMQIHPFSYHYWGQRLGYQCWQDDQFKREYLRDNPEARVKSVNDVPTVIVSGSGGLAASGKKRFHKAYGISREGGEGSEGARRERVMERR